MTSKSYNRRQSPPLADNSDTTFKMVFSSTNYDSFVIDPKNRPLIQEKLLRLYDAIAERNLLSDNPILIDKGRIVVDGQHRLKVAEAMGVPIYYILSDNATIADVPLLASRRSPWTIQDYLHHWCAEGREDYLRFRSFTERNAWLAPASAVMLCHYGNRLHLRMKFNMGEYDFNDEDFADRVVAMLFDFKESGFSRWNNKTFVDAVSNLAANANYDHERMLAKLSFNPNILRPAVTMDDYIAMINATYNYKVRAGYHVLLKRIYPNDPNYRVDRKKERSSH